LDDRAWTQVVALTGHDLIQNVPQQTVNIVREDTRSDNSLVRQPTAGQNDRNIGQNPVTQTMTVNDFIDKQFCTVRYSSVDEAVRMVQNLKPGALLAKIDVKSACRLLKIWPGDFDHLGFTFDGTFYFDKCLPMGASVSCSLFEKFTTALHWYTAFCSPHKNILHYLDDFLFGGETNTNQCLETLTVFEDVCKKWAGLYRGRKNSATS
jgi:hypothetical protein